MAATELTASERVALGLDPVSTLDLSLAAWDDGNSPTWEAMAELSETNPVAAGYLMDMWRRDVGRQGAASGRYATV